MAELKWIFKALTGDFALNSKFSMFFCLSVTLFVDLQKSISNIKHRQVLQCKKMSPAQIPVSLNIRALQSRRSGSKQTQNQTHKQTGNKTNCLLYQDIFTTICSVFCLFVFVLILKTFIWGTVKGFLLLCRN